MAGPKVAKGDSAIEAGDAKGKKVEHRRASSSNANVHNINDLGTSASLNPLLSSSPSSNNG
jgi:hypothetical protein